MSFTVPTIFKAIDKITAPVRKMQKSVQGFGRSASNSIKRASLAMNQFNKRVNSVFIRIKKGLGTLGLVAGFTAITMVVGGAVQKFADFEQANAGLAAVMGKTVEQNKALADNAKKLGAVTAKSATEVVGLQEAFARLGFAEDAILNMTKATIDGSVAMKGELSDTAELVGAMVKSFDQFESVNAPQIIDKLTKSTQASALNFEKLQTGLPIVAGAANAAKVPFTKLLASMGKLSDAGIDASSSTTALRNIFLEAAKRGVPYEKLLQKVRNSTDQLATANDLFGKRGAVAAVILAKNMKAVDMLDKSLQNAGGTAETAAAKQLDTLKGSVTILKSAWEGWILSLDDGNGAMSSFLKTSVQVITEILSMATGTAKAREEMTAAELRIRSIADKIIKLGKVLKIAVLALVAFKVAMIATNAVLAIGKFVRFVGIVMKIAKAKGVWTAAQWALNVAMNANPIGIIITAIAALTAGVIWLVKNWEQVVVWMKKVWEQFKNDKFIKNIIDKFNFFREVLRALIDKLKEIGRAIKEFVIDKFRKVSDFVKRIVDSVKRFFGRGDDTIKAEETLIVQAERQGNIQDLAGQAAGGDLINNFAAEESLIRDANSQAPAINEINNTNTREVITRNNNQFTPQQSNNRVDLFVNNRAGGTEVFTEGTGVNVEKTGF